MPIFLLKTGAHESRVHSSQSSQSQLMFSGRSHRYLPFSNTGVTFRHVKLSRHSSVVDGVPPLLTVLIGVPPLLTVLIGVPPLLTVLIGVPPLLTVLIGVPPLLTVLLGVPSSLVEGIKVSGGGIDMPLGGGIVWAPSLVEKGEVSGGDGGHGFGSHVVSSPW